MELVALLQHVWRQHDTVSNDVAETSVDCNLPQHIFAPSHICCHFLPSIQRILTPG